MTLPSITSIHDEFVTFIGPVGPLLDPYDRLISFCKYVCTLLLTYRDDYFDLYHFQLPWEIVSESESEYYLEVLDNFHILLRAHHPEYYSTYLSLHPTHIIHSRINEIEDYGLLIQDKGIYNFVSDLGPNYLSPIQYKQLLSDIVANGGCL